MSACRTGPRTGTHASTYRHAINHIESSLASSLSEPGRRGRRPAQPLASLRLFASQLRVAPVGSVVPLRAPRPRRDTRPRSSPRTLLHRESKDEKHHLSTRPMRSLVIHFALKHHQHLPQSPPHGTAMA
eukprot:2676353-Rhodomonas_salina.2